MEHHPAVSQSCKSCIHFHATSLVWTLKACIYGIKNTLRLKVHTQLLRGIRRCCIWYWVGCFIDLHHQSLMWRTTSTHKNQKNRKIRTDSDSLNFIYPMWAIQLHLPVHTKHNHTNMITFRRSANGFLAAISWTWLIGGKKKYSIKENCGNSINIPLFNAVLTVFIYLTSSAAPTISCNCTAQFKH